VSQARVCVTLQHRNMSLVGIAYAMDGHAASCALRLAQNCSGIVARHAPPSCTYLSTRQQGTTFSNATLQSSVVTTPAPSASISHMDVLLFMAKELGATCADLMG
jgi:hypothetical protein